MHQGNDVTRNLCVLLFVLLAVMWAVVAVKWLQGLSWSVDKEKLLLNYKKQTSLNSCLLACCLLWCQRLGIVRTWVRWPWRSRVWRCRAVPPNWRPSETFCSGDTWRWRFLAGENLQLVRCSEVKSGCSMSHQEDSLFWITCFVFPRKDFFYSVFCISNKSHFSLWSCAFGSFSALCAGH